MMQINHVLQHSSKGEFADFTEKEIQGLVSGDIIGREIRFLKEVDSTNIYASKLARAGMPEGSVVLADCQTRGKGRLNRVWQSPPGKNLYTSIILRPSIKPPAAPQLTLTMGVAVAELLSQYCPGTVTLKWPNDIQIAGKKICGILTEMRTAKRAVEYVVVGIGININIKKEEFEEPIREMSTSLAEETGCDISRVDFAVRLYAAVEKWYKKYILGGFDSVKGEWLRYSGVLNKNIQVNFKNEIQRGKVIGIDDYGALLLFDEEKKVSRILAGDVYLIGDDTCY